MGLENVIELSEPPMTTDDFALYAEKVPGLYIKLGVGSNYPLHSSNFDVDEECLRFGIEALHELVFELISR